MTRWETRGSIGGTDLIFRQNMYCMLHVLFVCICLDVSLCLCMFIYDCVHSPKGGDGEVGE